MWNLWTWTCIHLLLPPLFFYQRGIDYKFSFCLLKLNMLWIFISFWFTFTYRWHFHPYRTFANLIISITIDHNNNTFSLFYPAQFAKMNVPVFMPVRNKSKRTTMHNRPARGHIANWMALKNRGIWLKISALGYILWFQSNYLKKLPHFHVRNIFLAQKMKKRQGF